MWRRSFPLLLVVWLPLYGCVSEAAQQAVPCEPGVWLTHDGSRLRQAAAPELLAEISGQQVVLLGESHDSAEDHRWQLHTLAQLHARRPQLAIGFEMFPRRLQHVLDRWVAGELTETEFLRQTDWYRTWGYAPQFYLPLFHYARMNRLPMLALNVERSLVSAVDAKGWDHVPEGQREGVGRPAPPPAAYVEMLRGVYDHHPEKPRDEAAFGRFVQAQATWDRAMAEVIADHLQRQPDALVVGILGAGHVRFGHGVAHQLKDLGVERVANLLTWDAQAGCSRIAAGLADALYVVRTPHSEPPRLGVAMEPARDGVRIAQVSAGSVAEQAGLLVGDVVAEAAGVRIRTPQDMRLTVSRQPPGTWLPMKVRREGRELEIVARFPANP